MIWGISATIAAVILLGYAWRLNLKLKKLSNSFKELLQESRKQTPLEQRNKGDIYFHLDQDLHLTYINDVACQFFKTTAEKIVNQPILGNFMADTPANLAYLNSCLQKLKRNPQTINNEVIFMPEHLLLRLIISEKVRSFTWVRSPQRTGSAVCLKKFPHSRVLKLL